MKQLPTPDYDYNVNKLKQAYKTAMFEVFRELQRIDIASLSQANARSHLAEILRILSSLDGYSAEWVSENLPIAARDGVAKSLVELGIVGTIDEARTVVKFNRANKALIDAAIADTQSDLLSVTQNVERKVRSSVRRVTGEVMRNNYAGGTIGQKTIKREILEDLRKELGKSVETGIIDAGNKRWRPQVYVEMLSRTKMMETFNEATRNEAVQRGALYAVISSHGAKDACRYHEGRIMKLVDDAPGDYPTYEELKATGQIWHPNCKHSYSPIRRLDRLPDEVRDKAETQNAKGRQAIATGKRNPTDVD